MSTVFDHLTVTAPTLAAGAAYVRDALGVELQPGGRHPAMGTHNLLLSLGGASFLEVIAIDPDAPRPSRPRWFGLDSSGPQSPPRLAAWVVRTRSIHESLAGYASVFGSVEPISRGALSWLITVQRDGSLPLAGAAPSLIQWNSDPHPALSLESAGCALAGLEVCHPEPEQVRAILSAIDFESGDRVRVGRGGRPGLVAVLSTPNGLRTLSAA